VHAVGLAPFLLLGNAVPAEMLLDGLPACMYLTGCAVASWPYPMSRRLYLAIALGGLALSLLGGAVAAEVSFNATLNASADDSFTTPLLAYAVTSVLWPLGSSACAVAVLALGQRRMGPPARAAYFALAGGLLASAVTAGYALAVGVMLPDDVRVMAFTAALWVAVIVSVLRVVVGPWPFTKRPSWP
jgi:hypothetical protein